MRDILLVCLLLGVIGCSQSDKKTATKAEEKALTSAEIDEILENWKKDSTGCLQIRDPDKMKRVIEQLSLIGKDSLTVVSYLGEPNGKYGESTRRNYLYFCDCGKGQVSYFNAYCHFQQDTLVHFSSAVH